MPTLSMEDYLKALYHLGQQHPRVSTTALARWLGVAPASVTEMLRRLATWKPPLVDYRPRRGAVLTPAGQRIALRVIRTHRLLERFLHDVLGFPWDAVHGEAERLEHAASDEFIRRLAAWLGDPAYDPHGHPIPGPDLRLPPLSDRPLAQAPVGAWLTVSRVSDRDPALLRRLADLGLHLGRTLVLAQRTPYDHLLHLRLEPEGTAVVVGPRLAQAVFVRVVPAAAGHPTTTEATP